MNDHLILISGKSATGKSASLMGLNNPEGVIYANCESNKKLPFPDKFMKVPVTDPMNIYKVFLGAEKRPKSHTVIVDTLTYLMDQYETQYVIPATNGQKAWGAYAQFLRKLMQKNVATSTKNVIFLAHTLDVFNDKEQVMETFVKVKGSLMNNGIESFFSTIVSSKKMQLTDLENYKSDLLTISEEEEMLGFKYVFQTRLTKETVNERIRSPLGLWNVNETFIDNNAQLILDRLHKYYPTKS